MHYPITVIPARAQRRAGTQRTEPATVRMPWVPGLASGSPGMTIEERHLAARDDNAGVR
jgi:hypothetical protein